MAKKAKGKKSILLRLALLVFALYLVYSLGSLQGNLIEAKQELAALESEIETRKAANDELLVLLETGSEKDFIERAARDRLGYVYADEEVYTDVVGS